MQLHKFVAWWDKPPLKTVSAMFLVKLLSPVVMRFDGLTARGKPGRIVPVRVCDHQCNAANAYIGHTFDVKSEDLVAVQFGHRHN
jgi:hypothetical protein